ncbi:phosphoglycerate mutase (2,3-diphosphoglycerate-independent) [Candidatus Saccharibacteria bacterium]|nr:phosphoglycerate mutase (2,3-diphosphoglycerate-independent) [Candidatus Saccharibacteria bacterium]
MSKLHFDGPVVLAILDGVGLTTKRENNALAHAKLPFFAKISAECPHTLLNASGEAVGLLPGVMGNSEVGHNTIGCGQIFKHGSAHIKESFDNGSIWQSEAWTGVIKTVLDGEGHTLHFSGIFSDGDVHSNIGQLETMITRAYEEGVRRFVVHPVFDGRDVAPQSEPKYINRLNEFAKNFADASIIIADGGGRMTTTADRYGNDWDMVKRGWNLMMYGQSSSHFRSAKEGIMAFRQRDPEIQDQYLPDFVVVDENDQPVGTVKKGDAFIYFDFRADRAVEIATAFDVEDFDKFDRGDYRVGDVFFAGLTEYDSDKQIPKHQLIEPSYISGTLSEFLGARGISNLGVSETVKFGHITYYFNGNSYEKAPLEESIEVPSYTDPFDQCPWMKTREITDAVIENLDKYQFIRINYPGGDMVGHFAKMGPTVTAMETIDTELARLAEKVEALGGCLIVTADHGNAEELADENGEPKTSHTTNPVPFIIIDKTANRERYDLDFSLPDAGLSNIAATVATLLGQDDYPEAWRKPLIKLK